MPFFFLTNWKSYLTVLSLSYSMQDLLLCLVGSLVVARGLNIAAHRVSSPAACGIIVPWPGIEPTFPCIAVRIPNHWTVREAHLLMSLWYISWGGVIGFKDLRVLLCCTVLSRFSRVWLCATIWTVAFQAPLVMGFSRQEYWCGLPCPPQGIFPIPGWNLCL